ncbi:mCG146358, isoform CRA_b [Mus musculus]|nr:mCG146358, isoform CRA_b [Mus musculus]
MPASRPVDRQGILQRKKLQFKEWLACSHQACRQERQHPDSENRVSLYYTTVHPAVFRNAFVV